MGENQVVRDGELLRPVDTGRGGPLGFRLDHREPGVEVSTWLLQISEERTQVLQNPTGSRVGAGGDAGKSLRGLHWFPRPGG